MTEVPHVQHEPLVTVVTSCQYPGTRLRQAMASVRQQILQIGDVVEANLRAGEAEEAVDGMVINIAGGRRGRLTRSMERLVPHLKLTLIRLGDLDVRAISEPPMQTQPRRMIFLDGLPGSIG